MNIWKPLSKISFISKYFELKKANKILMDGMLRPSSIKQYYSQSPYLYPTFPYNRFFLYELAYSSDVLTSVHNALRRELFRNGIDLVESEKKDEETTTSEAETIPKGKTKEEILRFIESINENQQTVIDVLMEIEDDFSIMDNAFMVFLFDYEIDDDGKIKRKLREILRGDPRFMGPMINKFDRPAHDDNDKPLYFCPQHRDNLLEDKEICPMCGIKAWLAFYFKDFEGRKLYYARWEVIFRSKYRPTLRGGYPPVLTVWQKTRTMLFMDKYIMELYDGQRPPKSGLFFKTSNQAGLEKAIDEAKLKVNENPHWPLILGVPDSTNGQNFVQFIDFMRSLSDLQNTEMRNEFRRQIGAIYGVEPIFQGDVSTSGGLNNEGLQLTVTTRASEYGQAIYNNHFFPEILKAMGVEGWTITLNPSEEQDEMAKLTRQNQSLFNGQLALQVGLEAEYDDDTGEIIIQPGPLKEQEHVGDDQFGAPTTPPRPTGSPSIGKELIKARSRPPFTRLSNKLKLEIDKFIKRFKRKPSEVELSKAIGKINLNLQRELKDSTNRLFKQTYLREMGRVEKELGFNVLFDTVDENALVVLANQDVLSKAYSGITSNLTNELNGIIQEAYRDTKGLTTKQITDKIKDLTDVADFRAETIARTETGKVSSAARKTSYSKEEGFDTFLFKWIGPNDNRTTDTSKRIKARTKEGVGWSELIKIVEEESSVDFPEWTVDKNFPVSHYQSRHTFIKIPGTIAKSNEEVIRKELQEIEDKKLEAKKKQVDEELDLEIKKDEIKVLKDKEKLIDNLKNA